MQAEKAAEKTSRDVYFVNPVVDVLVAGGGLSILFYVVLALIGFAPWPIKEGGGVRPEWGIAAAAALSYVINWPHFAATNFRLYQSFDRMMQFPKTSFLSPIVVVGGMAWALADASFAPWYVKLFITWSGYHFCAQTKGITLLYARRLGVEIDTLTRWLIVIATHTPWLYAVIDVETYPDLGPYYSVTIPRGLPGGIALPFAWGNPVQWIATITFWVGCAAILLLLVRTFVVQGRFMPLAAIMPILAQSLWFGPLGRHSQAFNEFVPFFHSLQYMIIAWLFQLKEESARPGFLAGGETVIWETFKWLVWIIAGGIVMFLVIPYALSWRGYAVAHAFGCVNSAIQIHHFFVDGVIWKIRDPRTRAMLAGNLFDLAGFPREDVIRTMVPT